MEEENEGTTYSRKRCILSRAKWQRRRGETLEKPEAGRRWPVGEENGVGTVWGLTVEDGGGLGGGGQREKN